MKRKLESSETYTSPDPSRRLVFKEGALERAHEETVEGFRGTIGSVILPLKRELESAIREREVAQDEKTKQGIARKTEELSSTLTALELGTNLWPETVKQKAAATGHLPEREKPQVGGVVEASMMKRMPLEEALKRLNKAIEEANDPSSHAGPAQKNGLFRARRMILDREILERKQASGKLETEA